jgi:hypothetical protein
MASRVFDRALFGFARHRDGGNHHQRHGQDHAEEAGHDIVAGLGFGIVHLVHDQIERRRSATQTGERAFQVVPQRICQDRLGECDSAGCGGRVGCVGFDQDLRVFAAHQLPGEARRDRDNKGHFAPGQQVAGLAGVICLHDEVIIV